MSELTKEIEQFTDKKLDIMLMRVLEGLGGGVANPGMNNPVGRTLALANFLTKQGDTEGSKYVVNKMINIYKENNTEMYEAVKHLYRETA